MLDRHESGFADRAGLLRARLGIEPEFSEKFLLGLEISAGSGLSDQGRIENAFENKGLGLSQAHLGMQSRGLTLHLGKFTSYLPTSSLLFDENLRPEGFEQAYEFQVANFDYRFSAAQWVLDSTTASSLEGISQDQSWLFAGAFEGKWKFDPESTLALLLLYEHIQSKTAETANLSATRGNSFSGSPPTNSNLLEDFHVFEVGASLQGQPLGIPAQLVGSFAINLESKEQDRGFWAKGRLGQAWHASEILGELSYFYLEPDLQLALLSRQDFGFTNRQGGRLEISYFPESFFRLGASYLYAQRIAKSVAQSHRHELQIDLEARF